MRGYITLGEIAAKLRFLHVCCDRCNRWGRYSTARLVKQYGADASIEQFQNDITRDCARRGDPKIELGNGCAHVPGAGEDRRSLVAVIRPVYGTIDADPASASGSAGAVTR